MTRAESADQFTLLGERMRDTWNEVARAGDWAKWTHFLSAIKPYRMCARVAFFGDEVVHLRLEEHKDTSAAHWAAHYNDGSIRPLRVIIWRRIRGDWETIWG